MNFALLRWPFLIGFALIYLWPRYFFLSVSGKGISGFTAAAMLLLLLCTALMLFQAPFRRAFAAAAVKSPIVILVVLLWWGWRLATDIVGDNPGFSLGVTRNDALYLGSWFVIAMIGFVVGGVRERFPIVVACCGIIATVAGLVEVNTGQTFASVIGVANYQAGDAYQLQSITDSLDRDGAARAKSLFSHPIVYGQMLGAMAPIAMHLLVQDRGLRRVLGGVLVVCIVTSITLCNARSPYVIAVVAAGVYFGLYYFDLRNAKRMAVLLSGAAMLIVAAPAITGAFLELADGRTSEEAGSSSIRERQAQMGMAALEASPTTGFGSGRAPQYAGVFGRRNVRTVDNYYLSAAVETGFVGAALWCLMLTVFLVKGYVVTASKSDSATRGLAAICTSTIAALAVGLTILSITDTISLIFLLAGCLVCLAPAESRRNAAPGQRVRRAETDRSMAVDTGQ